MGERRWPHQRMGAAAHLAHAHGAVLHHVPADVEDPQHAHLDAKVDGAEKGGVGERAPHCAVIGEVYPLAVRGRLARLRPEPAHGAHVGQALVCQLRGAAEQVLHLLGQALRGDARVRAATRQRPTPPLGPRRPRTRT